MHSLTLNRAAKRSGVTAAAVREALAEAGYLHQDADLRWRATSLALREEVLSEHTAHFWHSGIQGYRPYPRVLLTPKGQRWLRNHFYPRDEADTPARSATS